MNVCTCYLRSFAATGLKPHSCGQKLENRCSAEGFVRYVLVSVAAEKLIEGKEAVVATGLTKWFGEGDAKVTAVNGVAFVAHFG